MDYIEFRINGDNFAIKKTKDFIIESTLINKFTLTDENQSNFIEGFINYKGEIINVVDISSLYGKEKMKKFDGLLFINNKQTTFALKYEGFSQIVNNTNNTIIDLNKIIQQF